MSSLGRTVTGSVTERTDDSPMPDARKHPVIHTPCKEPGHHSELDPYGKAIEGYPPKPDRRPAQDILPVPAPRTGAPVQAVLELNPDDINEKVEEIRVYLRNWPRARWEGANGVTRRFLAYWTRDSCHIRPFFAQT